MAGVALVADDGAEAVRAVQQPEAAVRDRRGVAALQV